MQIWQIARSTSSGSGSIAVPRHVGRRPPAALDRLFVELGAGVAPDFLLLEDRVAHALDAGDRHGAARHLRLVRPDVGDVAVLADVDRFERQAVLRRPARACSTPSAPASSSGRARGAPPPPCAMNSRAWSAVTPMFMKLMQVGLGRAGGERLPDQVVRPAALRGLRLQLQPKAPLRRLPARARNPRACSAVTPWSM